ncbi:MAG TPA: hypothetical protein VLA16_06355 [Ideonella sp.]|nr:hypothetical protein [Ideonella sp.]
MDDDTSYPLVLPFKGSRSYLHGSDIVPALLALSGPVDKPSFQFHRMATRPLCARRVGESELAALRRDEKLFVLMSYRDGGGASRLIAVVESGLAQDIARVPFDEEAIVAGARIEGQQICHDDPGTASFIERTIALHKALLNRVAGPTAWVFSRLDLAQGPVNPARIAIAFSRSMGGQVYKSDLQGDGQALGTIYFSRSAT